MFGSIDAGGGVAAVAGDQGLDASGAAAEDDGRQVAAAEVVPVLEGASALAPLVCSPPRSFI